MIYRVVLAPHIEAELEQAYRYIAARAPIAAIDWYNDCIEAIASLSTFPGRCPIAPESDSFRLDIRHLLHGRFRILFVIQPDVVYVVHIRHGAMKPLAPGGE